MISVAIELCRKVLTERSWITQPEVRTSRHDHVELRWFVSVSTRFGIPRILNDFLQRHRIIEIVKAPTANFCVYDFTFSNKFHLLPIFFVHKRNCKSHFKDFLCFFDFNKLLSITFPYFKLFTQFNWFDVTIMAHEYKIYELKIQGKMCLS